MSSSVYVRPFHREDRDQLTALVNAHAAAVVPGAAASVNTVLSSLERHPDEYVTDPWVAERVTLIAQQRQRVVAAAHLLRYRNDPDVGDDYRDAGQVEWFLHVPADPDDAEEGAEGAGAGSTAADVLMSACLAQLSRWHVRTRFLDGSLPVPGVYGLPDAWPHVRAVVERAGFVHTGDVEVVLLAAVDALPAPGPAPLPGLTVRRVLGPLGTRLIARLDGADVAYVELDTQLDRPERLARSGGTADVADFDLPDGPVAGLPQWLFGEARRWLALAGVDRLLAYAADDDEAAAERALLASLGFQELTRTARGWTHRPQ
ncbi:N-acetyltransferase [Streptomyces sp. NPDC017979]|uniref:N-acetyltransferase n=1 Tax=Streptomyces sp. NPDC017979 TaxID=3365024 RepID=UPI00379F5F47